MKAQIRSNYRRTRLLLGYLGAFLPLILVAYQWVATEVDNPDAVIVLPSISHYNFSYASVVFTGVVLSFGLLLLSYKGFEEKVFWNDNTLTNFAGFFALIVALVPTDFINGIGLKTTPNMYHHSYVWLNLIHLGAAVLFLTLLGVMSIVKFTKSKEIDEYHVRRKKYYKLCGWMIIGTILSLIAIFGFYELVLKESITKTYWVFGLECVVLFFFGFSWALKGKSSIFVPLGLVSKKELKEARGEHIEESTLEEAELY